MLLTKPLGCASYRQHMLIILGTVNDTYSVPGFGRKFLGVGLGGTLEIHGQQKLPWTKLTDTLSKMTSEAFASRTEVSC